MTNTYSQVRGRPDLPAGLVASTLADRYGIAGSLRPLPSERDQNFLVTTTDGSAYVAKVANVHERRCVLDLQLLAMRRLTAAGVGCPTVVETGDGAHVLDVGGHLFRVLTYLPGRLLADRVDRTPALLWHLGEFLANLVRGLAGFSHPAAERHLQWDVRHAADVIGEYLPDVRADCRDLVQETRRMFVDRVAPVLPELPQSVTHNDANDHNLVLDGDRVAGIIDFGDMVRSVTVNELAVGCAYAALEQPEPAAAVARVVGGYESVLPLGDQERALVPGLVRVRLATSVAVSAHQQALAPHDAYLSVSEAPAWEALARLDEGSR
ncbi:MAG: phosphotransferase [Streptosporangiales bacterium]